MDFTYINYLLFIFPGFCFVWTYRYFTKAPKIGDFEYAAWSFLFGSLIFLLTFGLLSRFNPISSPTIPTGNPAALLGAFLGISLGEAITLSFFIGFIFAIISSWGFFRFINNLLFKFIKK